jgi:hypothetical protein
MAAPPECACGDVTGGARRLASDPSAAKCCIALRCPENGEFSNIYGIVRYVRVQDWLDARVCILIKWAGCGQLGGNRLGGTRKHWFGLGLSIIIGSPMLLITYIYI